MKSDKNIVRDILKAQGLNDVEPTAEAIRVLSNYGSAKWREGCDDTRYDYEMGQ